MEEKGTFDVLPKKEVIQIKKEYEKLNNLLGGIREMTKLPQALIIVDPKKEYMVINNEGNRFASVVFRKKKVALFLIMPFGALNDPKELFSKVGRDKGKVGWNYSLEMRDEIELDYVFEMVKQSYDIANKDN